MATKYFQDQPYLFHVKPETETYQKLIEFFKKWLAAEIHFDKVVKELGITKVVVWNCGNSAFYYSRTLMGAIFNSEPHSAFKASKKLTTKYGETVHIFKSDKLYNIFFPSDLKADCNDLNFLDLGFLVHLAFGFTQNDNGFIVKSHHKPDKEPPADVIQIDCIKAVELGSAKSFCMDTGLEIYNIETLKTAIALAEPVLSNDNN